eukprot:UN00138
MTMISSQGPFINHVTRRGDESARFFEKCHDVSRVFFHALHMEYLIIEKVARREQTGLYWKRGGKHALFPPPL